MKISIIVLFSFIRGFLMDSGGLVESCVMFWFLVPLIWLMFICGFWFNSADDIYQVHSICTDTTNMQFLLSAERVPPIEMRHQIFLWPISFQSTSEHLPSSRHSIFALIMSTHSDNNTLLFFFKIFNSDINFTLECTCTMTFEFLGWGNK